MNAANQHRGGAGDLDSDAGFGFAIQGQVRPSTNALCNDDENYYAGDRLLHSGDVQDVSVYATIPEERPPTNDKKSVLFWFVGDAHKLWDVHNGKSWKSLFAFVKVAESLLRGIGQVCFANNPWSGILILIGLILADPMVGVGAIVASVTSLITSKILRQSDDVVVSGLQNYSAVLVGTVTLSLFPISSLGSLGETAVWCSVIAMSALSVCVGIGLGVFLSVVNLPVFTLPFNVVTSLMFLCFRGASLGGLNFQSDPINVHWDMVMLGVLKSAGQVYAVESIPASILILIGLGINSPILAIASFVGGLLGTFTGLLVTNLYTRSAVYAGVWGYNGFLAGGCIAFFATPSLMSTLIGVLNAIFATILQAGLVPVFKLTNLPVFTFPFCVSSLFFLPLVGKIPGLERVAEISFPEMHLINSRKQDREMGTSSYQTRKDAQDCEMEAF